MSPAARSRLAREILAFVRERDYVSFAALHIHFAGNAREPNEIVLPGNRVVWAGLPKPVIHAVLALLEAGELAAVPGSKGAYRHDGRVLDLPVERRPPPHDEPHWFPVLLRPSEALQRERQETSDAASAPQEEL